MSIPAICLSWTAVSFKDCLESPPSPKTFSVFSLVCCLINSLWTISAVRWVSLTTSCAAKAAAAFPDWIAFCWFAKALVWFSLLLFKLPTETFSFNANCV